MKRLTKIYKTVNYPLKLYGKGVSLPLPNIREVPYMPNNNQLKQFIVTKKLIPGRDPVTTRLNRNQPIYAIGEPNADGTMLVTLSPSGNGYRFKVPKEFLSAAA